MMIDFKENIELLEKIIFNFVLTEDDNDIIIKPKNYDSMDKREVIPLIKAHYFNDDTLQRLYREAKKFFLEYKIQYFDSRRFQNVSYSRILYYPSNVHKRVPGRLYFDHEIVVRRR